MVFHDWFSTVISNIEFLDDPPHGWFELLNDSCFQYVFDDDTSLQLADKWLTPEEITQRCAIEHSQEIWLTQERWILASHETGVLWSSLRGRCKTWVSQQPHQPLQENP
jgi:hypothetical protein